MNDLVPVCLDDLRPITAREHEAALEVIAQVKRMIARRDAGADAVWMPAGNWTRESADNDFMDAFRHVAAGGYEAVNNLRYYTNTLNGTKLLHFRPNPGMASVMPLPADARAAVVANLPRLAPLIDDYRKLRATLPPHLVISPPRVLAEVGADVDGVVVNQDTVRQQAAIATLWKLGVLGHLERVASEHGTAHVVEIGAGHGGLCRHLKRIIPRLTYTIIDLPETLLHSGIYLTLTAPEWSPSVGEVEARPFGVHLVPNFLFTEALAALPRVDLAINVSSFGEMEPAQVSEYAAGLSAAMAGGGILYECNQSGLRHIKADAAALVSAHFRASRPARADGVPAYEGSARLHANAPLDTMLLPPRPAQAAPPRNPLRQMWDRFRARPLSELPGRVLGKMRRLLGA